MNEGGFIQMKNQPTNFFLEKGKSVGKKRFEKEKKSYEEIIGQGEGEVNAWIQEAQVEISAERETLVQEVLLVAQKVVNQFSGREVVLQRDQIVAVQTGTLGSIFSNESTEGEMEKIVGHTFDNLQKVAVEVGVETSNLELALVLFHELMHLGSFSRIRFTNKPSHPVLGNFKPERNGLSILDDDGDAKFFKYLDEALTEKLARKYIEGQRKNPLYAKDLALREELFPGAVSGTYVNYEESGDGEKNPVLAEMYPRELQATDDFVHRLYLQNQERFSNEDEVWNIFFEAKFTGKLLKLARLIEKTEGKGLFRILGEQSNISQTERDRE